MSMLDSVEEERVREAFNSTEAQVRRDHAISHVLAALQKIESDMVFFGGTALSRTFLSEGRLSEDIDLYSSDRKALCHELSELPDLIEEEFPQAYWDVLPSQTADPRSSLLVCDTSIQIKIQVIDSHSRGWKSIPTNQVLIHQRYSDVPKTQLIVPTFDGFVAMKALAWFDRGTPRDLFDLEGLARSKGVSSDARELIMRLLGFELTEEMLTRKISGLWHEELAHQTKQLTSEQECLSVVLKWWRGVQGQ